MSLKRLYKKIQNKLQENPRLSPIWQRGVGWLAGFGVCWLASLLLGRIVVKAMSVGLESACGWLGGFDVVLMVFILIDFLILWKMSSAKGLKNEKLVLWGLVGLLGLNAVWGMGMEAHKGVYEFQIWWNYFVIILGLIIFYFRGQNIFVFLNRVKKTKTDIQREESEKLIQEKQREKEFLKNFSRINRIPVLKNIIRYIYKERWKSLLILILIFSVFISLRILIPVKFDGNYPDEYLHILSGLNFFEEGEFPKLRSVSDTYNRGAYMSLWVGLLLNVFGKNLFIAKLAPIFIGIINFVLVFLIARCVIKNKFFVYSTLLIFTFNSFSIFNHTYIRFYVFIELFLLLLVYLFFKIIKNIQKTQPLNLLVNVLLVITLNCVSYFCSNDVSKNLLLAATIIGFVYIYFFEIQKLKLNIKYISKPLNRIFNIGLKYKIIFTSLLTLLSYYFFNLSSKINLLLNASTNTSEKHIGFKELFFEINYLFAFPLLLVYFIYPWIKNSYQKITIVIFSALFLIHGISSTDLQIVRGMMYIFPLFYIVAFISLAIFSRSLFLKNNKKLVILFFTLLIIGSVGVLNKSYNAVFKNGYPAIPGEIGYHEYKDAYLYMQEDLSDHKIIIANYFDQIGTFYGFSGNYKLNLRSEPNNYYGDTGEVKKLYAQLPIIYDEEEFYNISKNDKTCVVLKSFSRDHFLNEESYNFILNNFEKTKEFIGFTFYCKD